MEFTVVPDGLRDPALLQATAEDGTYFLTLSAFKAI